MPLDESPVAPLATSRLWTDGATGGVAVLIMLVLASARPDAAPWLLTGAALVAVLTIIGARRRKNAVEAPLVATAAGAASAGADAVLLDSVFEAMDDPVLIIAGAEPDDIAGRRILLANRAARDLFRIQREGALLVSAMRDPNVLEAVDEALFGEVARLIDYQASGAQTRHWKASVRPLPSPQDGTRLAVLALRDETDVRRMEMMRVDFLANASHELRTPLASLSGFIETLKGHAKDDPKARDKFLDIMAAQAERMGRLVADLLSLSRIELNEHIPPAGRVHLLRAASDVVDAVSLLSQERGVTLLLDGEANEARITGDRDEIVQVIQNLVDNAIKYSDAGATVELTLKSGLDVDQAAAARLPNGTRMSLVTPDREVGVRYVLLTVRDYGPGMAREYLPRLTERFFRVEGQKSGERPGTGLGLAIVKHIVNRHRGGMTVESAPGEGTIFAVYFPMVAGKAQVEMADSL